MFQKNSFRKNIKTNIAIDDKIRDAKLKSEIDREAAKISALSSGKIDKYECLIGEELLEILEIKRTLFLMRK